MHRQCYTSVMWGRAWAHTIHYTTGAVKTLRLYFWDSVHSSQLVFQGWNLVMFLIAFWWDMAVHLTLPLFAEVGLACELIIILTRAATNMATRVWASFTLKLWANRGVPVPAMYEWFSLSFIPDAYLKQTSPPYKPATIRLTASV